MPEPSSRSSSAAVDTRVWPVVVAAASRLLVAAVMVRLMFDTSAWWIALLTGAVATLFLARFVAALRDLWSRASARSTT